MKTLGRISGIGLLCLLHLGVCVDALRRSTPTVDEVAHLPAGITYLQKRTFRLYPHNPPLVRMIAAAAALPFDLRVDYTGTWKRHWPQPSHWLFAFECLTANSQNPQSYLNAFTAARLTTVLWSLLTIPVLYFWGRWWFSEASGWLAAALWTFSPNIVAHAGFVTTDIPAASTGFMASFLFARWLAQPTWKRTLAAGAALGAAQVVKFSCLLLYPMWTAWLIADLVHSRYRREPNDAAPPLKSIALHYFFMLAASVFVVNATYLFEGSFHPIGKYQLYSETLTRARTPFDPPPTPTKNATLNLIAAQRINRFSGTWLAALPTPFPYYYVAGFDEQKFESEGKYQMYLRGKFASDDTSQDGGRTGWWYYYFYALAVKLPVATLALLAIACRRQAFGPRLQPFRWLVLVFLVSVPLLGMSFLTDINIGLRYALGLFPFLFLLAGAAVRSDDGRLWKSIALLAVAANVVALWRVHPHELSYFNELAGGPERGRFHLIDSNIDWGQDLRNLAGWLEKHPEWQEAKIAYFGSVPPEFEGISNYDVAPRMLPDDPNHQFPWESADDPTSYGPQPGKFIVSVNFERGMFHHTPFPLRRLSVLASLKPSALRPGPPMVYVHKDAHAYFQRFRPRIEPEVGYSLLFYDVDRVEANRVRSEMGLPLLPAE